MVNSYNFRIFVSITTKSITMTGHPIKHSDALSFILAGKAIVTFLNTQSENRFTFKVKKAKDGDFYFVSLLTSPETYQYIGTVSNGTFRLGKKSKVSGDAQSVKVFDYVMRKIKSNTLPSFIEVWHEGRCGRSLTVPSSIESGLGPECIKLTLTPDKIKQLKREKALTLILN